MASGRETAATAPGKYHVRVHFGLLLSKPFCSANFTVATTQLYSHGNVRNE